MRFSTKFIELPEILEQTNSKPFLFLQALANIPQPSSRPVKRSSSMPTDISKEIYVD